MTAIPSALIVGGAGFLGRHLAWDLVERGCPRVLVFDLFVPPKGALPPHTQVIKGNLELEDLSTLIEALSKVDVVFHVASPPYHLNDRDLFYRVNVNATRRLLEVCRSAGIRKFVLTSSCSVVYNGQDLQNADETMPYPSSFLDCYTETKMLQERIVVEAHTPDFQTVVIRPHGIFGPHDHTVSEMIKKAQEGKMKFQIGDGTNLVDFTHVRNVTFGHILAAEHLGPRSVANGQIYNITNDEPVQFWVFLGVVLAKLGYTPPAKRLPYALIYALALMLQFVAMLLSPFVTWTPFLSPFKVALAGTHHYYCCDKAKRDLGYQPVMSLEQGIEDTVRSYAHLRRDDDAKSKKVA